MPVGRGKDKGLDHGVLVGALYHQIVLAILHLLNNGFKGTAMPYHLDLEVNLAVCIGSKQGFQPLFPALDYPLTHFVPLGAGQHRGHFIGKVVDGQKQGDAGLLLQRGNRHGPMQGRLIFCHRIHHHQNVLILDHKASLS